MTQYECHKMDTQTQVFFYEQDFYVLSNFSAFQVVIWGEQFPTSEHAYHWEKFRGERRSLTSVRELIKEAPSAHVAFQIAQGMRHLKRSDWEECKQAIMKLILTCKVQQHEYVRKKLLDTGDRELIEDSWRDSEWGWGPNKDGKNLLGKIWMEIRKEVRDGKI